MTFESGFTSSFILEANQFEPCHVSHVHICNQNIGTDMISWSMQGGHIIAHGPVCDLLTKVPLLEQDRLEPPSITRFFYKKALM